MASEKNVQVRGHMINCLGSVDDKIHHPIFVNRLGIRNGDRRSGEESTGKSRGNSAVIHFLHFVNEEILSHHFGSEMDSLDSRVRGRVTLVSKRRGWGTGHGIMVINRRVLGTRRGREDYLFLRMFVSRSHRVTLVTVRRIIGMWRRRGGGKVVCKPVQSTLMKRVENIRVFRLINVHLFHCLVANGKFLFEVFIPLRTRWKVKGNWVRNSKRNGDRETGRRGGRRMRPILDGIGRGRGGNGSGNGGGGQRVVFTIFFPLGKFLILSVRHFENA